MMDLRTIREVNAAAAIRHAEGVKDNVVYTPIYEGAGARTPKPAFVHEAFQLLWQIVNDREVYDAGRIARSDYELALHHNIKDATKMFKEMGDSNDQ